MKKKHRNFYILNAIFAVGIASLLLYSFVYSEKFSSFSVLTIMFFAAGVYAVLFAVLSKVGFVGSPNDEVSKYKYIPYIYSFYDYLFLAAVYLLCGLICYAGSELVAITIMLIGALIRVAYFDYAKKFYKDK